MVCEFVQGTCAQWLDGDPPGRLGTAAIGLDQCVGPAFGKLYLNGEDGVGRALTISPLVFPDAPCSLKILNLLANFPKSLPAHHAARPPSVAVINWE
jgi:hypothetical protein